MRTADSATHPRPTSIKRINSKLKKNKKKTRKAASVASDTRWHQLRRHAGHKKVKSGYECSGGDNLDLAGAQSTPITSVEDCRAECIKQKGTACNHFVYNNYATCAGAGPCTERKCFWQECTDISSNVAPGHYDIYEVTRNAVQEWDACVPDVTICPHSSSPLVSECGPNSVHHLACHTASKPYCDEATSTCGEGSAHRDAQPSAEYDYCSSAAVAAGAKPCTPSDASAGTFAEKEYHFTYTCDGAVAEGNPCKLTHTPGFAGGSVTCDTTLFDTAERDKNCTASSPSKPEITTEAECRATVGVGVLATAVWGGAFVNEATTIDDANVPGHKYCFAKDSTEGQSTVYFNSQANFDLVKCGDAFDEKCDSHTAPEAGSRSICKKEGGVYVAVQAQAAKCDAAAFAKNPYTKNSENKETNGFEHDCSGSIRDPANPAVNHGDNCKVVHNNGLGGGRVTCVTGKYEVVKAVIVSAVENPHYRDTCTAAFDEAGLDDECKLECSRDDTYYDRSQCSVVFDPNSQSACCSDYIPITLLQKRTKFLANAADATEQGSYTITTFRDLFINQCATKCKAQGCDAFVYDAWSGTCQLRRSVIRAA